MEVMQAVSTQKMSSKEENEINNLQKYLSNIKEKVTNRVGIFT